jgi:UDP-galactopyranose mutase
MKKILVVGAGFSGAVIARELAESGYFVDVFEERDHIAGNCYTHIDPETEIMVHDHGPHIFHTDNDEVWSYVNKFSNFHPYITQVKATTKGRVFSLPINLLTINQFFSKDFSPLEAMNYISSKSINVGEIRSFEDQALSVLGQDLYESFFKGYPIKQWGVHPRELPASVLKRLPVRFNYNDNYFEHRYQGIPADGYTYLIDNILRHESISVQVNRAFKKSDRANYDHVFYSGTLDGWFDYKLGNLRYRTLKFEISRHLGDFQGCAVMSYPDEEVPYTRITEHKYFTPWRLFDKTIISHEYSRHCKLGDAPYYPVRLVNDKKLLSEYIELANSERGVTFVGRLGTYRYLDMDVTINEAINAAKNFINLNRSRQTIPVLFNEPI